jgi:hypothetical protein
MGTHLHDSTTPPLHPAHNHATGIKAACDGPDFRRSVFLRREKSPPAKYPKIFLDIAAPGFPPSAPDAKHSAMANRRTRGGPRTEITPDTEMQATSDEQMRIGRENARRGFIASSDSNEPRRPAGRGIFHSAAPSLLAGRMVCSPVAPPLFEPEAFFRSADPSLCKKPPLDRTEDPLLFEQPGVFRQFLATFFQFPSHSAKTQPFLPKCRHPCQSHRSPKS